MTHNSDQNRASAAKRTLQAWISSLLLILILVSGAYLRLVGLDWDEEQHLHPDERFLTMVEAAIKPIGIDQDQLGLPPSVATQPWRETYKDVLPDCEEWGGYFDTACSPLNPNNRGYDFYVYGTLPIFIVRYTAEFLDWTGYGEVYLVGRMLSALADLLSMLLIYAVALKIYDQRVALLATAFAAFSVLLIQQSHFFTVDTFTNLFIMLALYFAASITVTRRTRPEVRSSRQRVMERSQDDGSKQPEGKGQDPTFNNLVGSAVRSLTSHPIFWPSLFFGFALGMAVASKINAAAVAVTLPAAALVYIFRVPSRLREKQLLQVFIILVLAAIVSVVAFRIFQPYAFTGPGFFGIKPNRAWIDDLRALQAQTSGDVDFPPALQWARRPIWFSFQNLVLWGLGLPLGIVAWLGFIWMGWQIFQGYWVTHGLLWGWTALYFVWQSQQWNSTMRYQLPIYPTLAIFASWFIIHLWDKSKRSKSTGLNIKRLMVFVLGGSTLFLTFFWAYGFSRIYPRPHTRVEATRWIFQNIPGPVNLTIHSDEGDYNQPLSYPSDVAVQEKLPQQIQFTAKTNGRLADIYLPYAVDRSLVRDSSISLTLSSAPDGTILVEDEITAEEIYADDEVETLSHTFLEPIILERGKRFTIELQIEDEYDRVSICDPFVLELQTLEGPVQVELAAFSGCLQGGVLPFPMMFEPETDGILQQVSMGLQVGSVVRNAGSKTLTAEVLDSNEMILGTGQLESVFQSQTDLRGQPYRIPLSENLNLIEGQVYRLKFSLTSGTGAIALSGSRLANESSWDDGLPLRMDGYDPYGGIYEGGLNFEMYWDDNQEKLERFVTTLDQADFIFITSSRQWGSTTRVPERYPLTTEYYDRLMGCPADHSIEWCYSSAQPGIYQGDLGFELVRVFQSNPSIRELEINDQFAEEAFTVYDHPKVFVFQKSNHYDPVRVREILESVDLSKVIRVTPKQAESHPGDLELPTGRLEEQRKGGTWSEYFKFDGLQNRVQILAVIIWYGSVSLLGLIVYPLVRFALPGLHDRGYPMVRITGLLLLSGLVWLAGSARIPFNRTTIGLVLFGISLLNLYLGYQQWDELKQEFKTRWKYYLRIEGLFLVFFGLGLLIKLGNPDLWHPWKGGEKPMDFSYFNAVLKSTSFPPYDPWFAGGYINYYYYGFVVVGVLVKFLGIVPSIAYNLILPTLFSMIAVGAFSITWNLFEPEHHKTDRSAVEVKLSTVRSGIDRKQTDSGDPKLVVRDADRKPSRLRYIAGAAAAFGMAVLGNLGILQMFSRGLQLNIVSAAEIEAAGLVKKFIWTISGLFKTITGTAIPIRMDEWYWNPSRVIGHEHGNPITEFPFFTFLYGDLHAHLIALPVALLAITWAVSVVKGRAWRRKGGRSWLQVTLGFLVGGLAVGALYPINLSDIYTYLPLGIAAFTFTVWRYVEHKGGDSFLSSLPKWARSLWWILFGMVGLYAISKLIYQPYWHWYGQGYSEINIWTGTHTPLMEYLVHWGAFLFVIISWMIYESVDWMASTPVSALRKLEPYRALIWAGVALLVVFVLVLGVNLHPGGLPPEALPIGLGVHIAWLVLPLSVWAGVLLLRPGLSDSKRVVLFFIGTGLVLTLMVEIIVVSGDIGRMNTVFKFYLQVWTLFAVSCGAALGWLILSLSGWSFRWRTIFQILLTLFVFSTALYPLLATTAKISDRMESSAPHTLDGMTFMKYATYHDEGVAMDLSQDYHAIRWMQDNVSGSPVIVEANSVEYHWGTRFTIYTGLPGVVGWNWHQRQQRTINPHEWVFNRVEDVHEFYLTEDLQWAYAFLEQYDVSYIVLGQLERAKYPGPGLNKFEDQDGILWREVYRDRDTVLYEVINGGV